MDDEQFASILADINGPADDGTPAAEEAATAAAAPDATASPDTPIEAESRQDTTEATSSETEALDAESLAATAETEPTPETEAGPEDIAIDDPRHPYHQVWVRAQQAEVRDRQVAQQLAAMQQVASQERVRNTLLGLPDTDPDQLVPTALRLMSDVVTPVRQEANANLAVAEQVAANLTMQHLAMQSVLPPETIALVQQEMQRLGQQFNDPRLMEQSVRLNRQRTQSENAELTDLRTKYALLQKQVAALGRDPNADVVGGTGATGSAGKPKNADDYTDFNEFFGDLIEGRLTG